MSQPSSPLETALDLLVYLPVGVALALGEEVPRLTAKGRARVGNQVAAARLIGQFAVGQGRRMMAGSGPPAPVSHPTTAPRPEAAARPGPARGPATPPGPAGTSARTAPRPPTPPPSARRVAKPSPADARSEGSLPAAGSLAIPGYDSLSASQVVQRLAGLTPDELEAVARYEAEHRGRRTILARATQLQHR